MHRLGIRLELGAGARIGPGKIRLLELIAETGSISAAGRQMGMSYRRAWRLVDSLNRMFAEPVLAARPGGAGGGGAQVTPFGLRLIAVYREIETRATAATDDLMHEMMRQRADPDQDTTQQTPSRAGRRPPGRGRSS